MARRNSREINVGGVRIGGDAGVSVQSMTNTDTRDAAAALSQIESLAAAGCQIVRLAVPDMDAARALKAIRESSPIPIVADIHFDYRLALAAVESGADKLRINPGNIGGEDRVEQVARSCMARGVPIRIGVNGGSLEKDVLARYGGVCPEALTESALKNAAILEKYGFQDICISVKTSSVPVTIEAYRMIAGLCGYPLHLGVTEAGTPYMGIIKSAIGIGSLLCDGIGDTVRVSLTADPVEEIRAGIGILRAAGIRKSGVEVVSCPTCGRCGVDLISMAAEVETRLAGFPKSLTVAVMGCPVNGPGEAKAADYGIAGGDGSGLVFSRGEVLRRVRESELVDELIKTIHMTEGIPEGRNGD